MILSDEQLQRLRDHWRAVEQKRAREEAARAQLAAAREELSALTAPEAAPTVVDAQRAFQVACLATNHAVDEYHEALVGAFTAALDRAGSPT